jgi:flagellar basal-body rod protein FlgG
LLEGLYTAATGMAAQQERLDALANDVANVSTPGYKAQRVAFRDLLYGSPAMGGAPAARVGSGVATRVIGGGLGQGALNQTGNPLDVALEGEGFFRVRRADGTMALTRQGAFHLDPSGRVVTAGGDLVMPGINIPRDAELDQLHIDPEGEITLAGRRLGRLDIVEVTAPERLTPTGDGLYVETAASGAARRGARAVVQQGTLETSNVDLGDAMVGMMDAQRAYQLASRAIQIQDQMMEIANGVKR